MQPSTDEVVIKAISRFKNRKAKVEEVIERTGLGPEVGKTIGKLSKGYRQRVGLAAAILHSPKVLVLDDGTHLIESWAICDWLDETAPSGRRLLPAGEGDDAERGRGTADLLAAADAARPGLEPGR